MFRCIIHIETTDGDGKMRTNIVIDDDLIRQAMQVTGLRTKRAAVEAGLKLLVEVKSQTGIRGLRGKLKLDANHGELRASRA
jgi:Arc/MetJ family transcription regulator